MYSETFLADLKSRVTVSEVVSRSVKLRRDGKEFRAIDNASLTVNDAKSLWWDHATNEGGDALAWLQKSQGLSFTDAVAEIASIAGVPLPNGDGEARPQQQGATTKRKPVASYNYCDSQGELIYEVVRLEWIEDGKLRKTFRQRRPDPDRPNGWIWNLEGIKHGLYRLPELREAGADEIVFLPEGEKDCLTLAGFGLCATTNSGAPRIGGKIMPNYFAIVTSSSWSTTMIQGASAARPSPPRCTASPNESGYWILRILTSGRQRRSTPT